ncbi:MAG: hypothetical protein ACRDRI_07550 [Pseudonocardiaceae bacterium]
MPWHLRSIGGRDTHRGELLYPDGTLTAACGIRFRPRELLRGMLRDVAQAGPYAPNGIGSVQFRATVTLYMLLVDHPIDRWDRCRSCRRPGAVFGWRWRSCQVRSKANLYLCRLDEVLLLSLLPDE